VQAGVTGAPALSNDEMTSAFHDSSISDVLAFALTLVVMTLAFMRVGKPVLMLAVLAVTLAWSMGLVTLVVGHLTLFSVMFISIDRDGGPADDTTAASIERAAEQAGGWLLGARATKIDTYLRALRDYLDPHRIMNPGTLA
jgi:hypothetical protein